jgi:hypothetical protein
MTMRKPFTFLVLITAIVALGAGTALGSSKAPRLVVLKSHPLTVQGRHFKPHAHVRVTLTSSGQTTKRVTVSRSGTFTVTFTQTLDRCTQWTVRATVRGHAPVLVRGPKPACTPY